MSTGKTILLLLAIAIAVIGGIAALGWWFNAIDAGREQTYDAYEKCVQAEYHMRPSDWYEEHGEAPVCHTEGE